MWLSFITFISRQNRSIGMYVSLSWMLNRNKKMVLSIAIVQKGWKIWSWMHQNQEYVVIVYFSLSCFGWEYFFIYRFKVKANWQKILTNYNFQPIFFGGGDSFGDIRKIQPSSISFNKNLQAHCLFQTREGRIRHEYGLMISLFCSMCSETNS